MKPALLEDGQAANESLQQTASVHSHCPYCSLQCGINLVPGDTGPRLEPWPEFPTSRGGLCQKGWTATDLLGHPDRLTSPLVRDRRSAPFRPAPWDEALDRVADELHRCQERYGLSSVGVFGGGGLTNEKAYLLGKFARVALRTSQIDYNGRFCMSSAATASNMAFGIDRGLPFPVQDLAGADVILLAGSNVAETMPPVGCDRSAWPSRGRSSRSIRPWPRSSESATVTW